MDKAQIDRAQYAAYASLCLIMLAMVVVSLPSLSADFQRFFGPVNPVLVTAVAALGGGVVLVWLRARWGLQIVRGWSTVQGMGVALGLATLLAGAIVVADLLIRYPENLNVPMPGALLFYPTIGFVAEMVFHVAPLAVLLLIFAQLDSYIGASRALWLALFLVAAVEPTFQIVFMDEPFSWAVLYTWVHVYIISLLQLLVFRRFDFFSMYTLRLVYYLYWHIIWGTWRLDILF